MKDDNSVIYNPENVLKKEARGVGEDVNFGEIQVGVEYIITQKGILDKDKYHIPKNLVDRFEDGVAILELQQKGKKTQRT